MLTKRAKDLIRDAHPLDEVAFILSISDRPIDSIISAIPDRKSRREFVNEFYRRLKAPVIAQVMSLEGEGLRIVDPLDGTPQLIVAAPAHTWRSVFRRPSTVLKAPKVTITTNEAEVTLP